MRVVITKSRAWYKWRIEQDGRMRPEIFSQGKSGDLEHARFIAWMNLQAFQKGAGRPDAIRWITDKWEWVEDFPCTNKRPATQEGGDK